MITDCTGVILSGGKSSRLKTNKALLDIFGEPLIQSMHRMLNSIFKSTAVISNEPELYSFLNTSVYTDIYSGLGPLSGIHSALFHSSSPNIFVLSCDMPLMTAEMINRIYESTPEATALLPSVNSYIQPLAARYNTSLLPTLEKYFSALPPGTYPASVYKVLASQKIMLLELDNLSATDSLCFFNLNTQADLIRIKELIAQHF